MATDLPEPKLTYFLGYGLAEQARWMLAFAVGKHDGSGWTFRGLETHEEFCELRETGQLLFKQLPLLEIDGLRLVQSQAIVRYLARKASVQGETEEEMVTADIISETIRDSRASVTRWPFNDHGRVLQDAKIMIAKVFPVFESLLSKHRDTPFFFASGISYADILLAELVHELYENMVEKEVFSTYPMTLNLHATVTALPSIAGYLRSDKRFPFPNDQAGIDYADNVDTVLGKK